VTVGEPAQDGPAEEHGGGEAGHEGVYPAIPPLADALLGPLLDSAGEALRRLPPADVPPAARRLRSFDRRGLATPAARHQLRRLLEDDEELLGAAAAVLLGRPESSRLAAAWEEAVTTGGGGPLALVDETAREGRLPLLASVLTAALPAGFEFGLGLVVAMAATGERETAAAQAVRAATAAQGAAEEAGRRAEAARATAAAEAARLDAALREERQSRRDLEQQAADASGASDTRRADLEAALAEARQRLSAAEQRTTAAERHAAEAAKRTAEAEQRTMAAEQAAAEAQRRSAAAERAVAQFAGTDRPPAQDRDAPTLDAPALDQVARAAEDLAAALRRLASASPGRDTTARGSAAEPGAAPRRPAAARPPPARRTVVEKAPPARAAPASRRAPVQVPPGMLHDDPAAVAAMVRTPGVAVIVDGYNVSMLAWPEASAADQRDRLCDALVEFQLRVRCEVTVVFDGADVSGVRPLRRRGLRVVFSAAGQEADEVVVGEVMFRPAEVPVVVVSSDRGVRTAAELEGATVLPADAFLQLMKR
jgi:predicted RNA-binding protein with PIN domain